VIVLVYLMRAARPDAAQSGEISLQKLSLPFACSILGSFVLVYPAQSPY
jgi:hypothetical protein